MANNAFLFYAYPLKKKKPMMFTNRLSFVIVECHHPRHPISSLCLKPETTKHLFFCEGWHFTAGFLRHAVDPLFWFISLSTFLVQLVTNFFHSLMLFHSLLLTIIISHSPRQFITASLSSSYFFLNPHCSFFCLCWLSLIVFLS